MIMVTGDDRLKQDLATMPWLQYVVTKQAVAADSALPRPVAQVHAEMQAAAKQAVTKRAGAKIMTLASPLRAALRTVPPASLELMKGVPGVEYHDNTVEFTAKDFGAAYDGLVALVGVASQPYARLYPQTLRAMGPAPADSILKGYSDRLFQRWMDVESGRWKPPAPSAPVAGRRYHGAN